MQKLPYPTLPRPKEKKRSLVPLELLLAFLALWWLGLLLEKAAVVGRCIDRARASWFAQDAEP